MPSKLGLYNSRILRDSSFLGTIFIHALYAQRSNVSEFMVTEAQLVKPESESIVISQIRIKNRERWTNTMNACICTSTKGNLMIQSTAAKSYANHGRCSKNLTIKYSFVENQWTEHWKWDTRAFWYSFLDWNWKENSTLRDLKISPFKTKTENHKSFYN